MLADFSSTLYTSHMSSTQPALCPSCRKSKGEVFTICPNSVCADKGYHLVPSEYVKGSKRPDILAGQVVDDRYLLVKKLGEGGMGQVFLAMQKPLMQEVAIKFLSMTSGTRQGNTMKLRFEREARVLAVLDHPHIVRLFDYGLTRVEVYGKELPFMVIEYIKDGITLRELLNERRRQQNFLAASEVLTIFDQVANALAAAHNHGLVHRDLKPENIMVRAVEGNPLYVNLLDFGLTKAKSAYEGDPAKPSDFNQELTVAGGVMGTPYYMPPEQILGAKDMDQRVDIYALGMILFECLTGHKPFAGIPTQQVITKKIKNDFRILTDPNISGLPPGIQNVLDQATAFRPKERFATIQAFQEAVHLADEGREVTSDSPVVIDDVTSPEDKTMILAVDESDLEHTLEMQSTLVNPPKHRFWLPLLLALAVLAGAAVFWKMPATRSKPVMKHFVVVHAVPRTITLPAVRSPRRIFVPIPTAVHGMLAKKRPVRKKFVHKPPRKHKKIKPRHKPKPHTVWAP